MKQCLYGMFTVGLFLNFPELFLFLSLFFSLSHYMGIFKSVLVDSIEHNIWVSSVDSLFKHISYSFTAGVSMNQYSVW